MSSTESLYQGFGGISFPLDVANYTGGLTPLDPAKATLTALFKSAVNSELGEVWTKLFKSPTYAAGLPSGHPLRDSNPISSWLELEPTPQLLKQLTVSWPLLCVHRTGTGVYGQQMLHEDRLTQQWLVHYILGPLDAGDLRKFETACVAFAKIVSLVIRQRGHRSYENGALQFFPGAGNLASVELKNHEGPGQAALAGDESGALYYAITLTLETTEITSDRLDAYGELEGVMFEVGVGDSTGIVPGLVYADTAVPLQIG